MDHTLVNGPRVDQVHSLVHVDCTLHIWMGGVGETKSCAKSISHVLKVHLSYLARCISQMCW